LTVTIIQSEKGLTKFADNRSNALNQFAARFWQAEQIQKDFWFPYLYRAKFNYSLVCSV
jgi:hypothetical protein